MLLDNHYAPDRRVEFETELLRRTGLPVRIVAWDRRTDRGAEAAPPDVVRINVPAPPGGGRRSFAAMLRFARDVWNRRDELVDGARLLIVHDIYLLPLGRLLSHAMSIPFAYDAHEEYARMEAMRYPRPFLAAATKVENALARAAVFVVVPGTTRVRRWTDAQFDRVVVLRNTGSDGRVPPPDVEPEWDVLYAGILARPRRLDLLLEMARLRPDIRVAIAGAGKLHAQIDRAASKLENVTFLGWRTDVPDLIARSRSLYYGLDPAHPDAETACPNTLYLALSHARPLVYFGGGEISEVARRFRIGLQAPVSAEGLGDAVDRIRGATDWELEAAWASVTGPEERAAFVAAVIGAVAG